MAEQATIKVKHTTSTSSLALPLSPSRDEMQGEGLGKLPRHLYPPQGG